MKTVSSHAGGEVIHTQCIGLQLLLQKKIITSYFINKNVLIIQQYTYYNNKLCLLSIIDTNPPVRCIADRFVEFASSTPLQILLDTQTYSYGIDAHSSQCSQEKHSEVPWEYFVEVMQWCNHSVPSCIACSVTTLALLGSARSEISG